jgi:Protein of unknown function (DUF3108)
LLAGLFATSSALCEESMLQPFHAQYLAEWKSISVGTSEIVLKKSAAPGEYEYMWTIAARGIFKVVYDKPVTQTSWFSIEEGHARSRKYLGSEGDASVSLDFDWPNKRITGLSEKKPVNISFKDRDSAHDINSIQVEVMLDLMNGNLAKSFAVVDKDQLKDFNYTQEGAAKLRTAIGMLDTVIVASQRTGNSRILRMWFAPALGYMPVQAERWRDGKLEFAIRIKSQSHTS